jgi:mono/diheme cytochrome c family protein
MLLSTTAACGVCRLFIRISILLLSIVSFGCNQAEPPVYVVRKEALQLSDKHRQELGDYLTKFYGTPLNPLYRVTDAAAEKKEDAAGSQLKDHLDRAALLKGREVYTAQCAGCHGTSGDGEGPAAQYLDPRPRDYRKGVFKFTSSPRGRKPRQEDLVRIIRYGAKGTSMPAFRWMQDDELLPLIAYVKSLSSRGELEIQLVREAEDELDEADSYDPATVGEYADAIAQSWTDAAKHIVLPSTTKVPYTPETIELGARAFVKESCYKCHGIDGRGNRQNNVGKDDWGQVAFAANLANGMLHGGRRPLDIYRRIHSGINGTPMPGYGATLDSQGKAETVWHLTHFVTSIVEGRELPKELLAELAKEAEEAVKKQLEEAAGAVEGAKPAAETPATETPTAEKSDDSKTVEAKPSETPDTETKTESNTSDDKKADPAASSENSNESKASDSKSNDNQPSDAEKNAAAE